MRNAYRDGRRISLIFDAAVGDQIHAIVIQLPEATQTHATPLL